MKENSSNKSMENTQEQVINYVQRKQISSGEIYSNRDNIIEKLNR